MERYSPFVWFLAVFGAVVITLVILRWAGML